ncbi:MAG: metallophosphoesterase [Trueperaceae bacterium]|nr:MAG: metallophosphoesterase [Trueperaceae bacterium]
MNPTEMTLPTTRKRVLIPIAMKVGQLFSKTLVGGAYRFGITRHRVPTDRLTHPLKLVQLSDLHFGPFHQRKSLDAWVDATLAEAPEVIVVTGDFIDHLSGADLEPLASALKKLRAPLGVWGVWGNHDRSRAPHIQTLEQVLDRSGIKILNNRGVLLRNDLFLAGVDDFHNGRPDLELALGARPTDAACILLSHNPDLLPQVPASVGLTLCGHTHGGQIKLPLIGPPLTSSRYGKRFAEGWVEAAAPAYVSRGLGTSMLPIRFNCPPELSVLELLPTVV